MKRKSEESEEKTRNLTQWYYQNEIGYYPWDTDTNKQITQDTLQYLVESGISDEEILKVMQESKNGIITPDSLPDWLWENSLIERNKYYTSRLFHLESDRTKLKKMSNGARVLIMANDFWLEIIPRFTLQQLINYYYCQLPNAACYNTDKQDVGVFSYLLKRYEKLSQMSPYVTGLDLIISAIDKLANENAYLSDPFELTKTIDTMLPEILKNNKIGYEQGKCKIIWRSHKLTPDTSMPTDPYDLRRKPGCIV